MLLSERALNPRLLIMLCMATSCIQSPAMFIFRALRQFKLAYLLRHRLSRLTASVAAAYKPSSRQLSKLRLGMLKFV